MGTAASNDPKTNERTLIQEIVDLAPHAAIPPEVFAKFPIRLIGESLVERVRRTHKDPKPGLDTYDFSRADILIFSSGRHLSSWASKAGKPNVYAIDPKNLDMERLATESRLIGLNLKKIPSEPVTRDLFLRLMPNYGQLNVEVRPEFAELNVRSSEVYGKLSDPEIGGVIAVAHEFVKRRATWFPMDSNLSLIPVKARALGVHKLKPPFLQYAEVEIWGGFGLPDIREFWVPESDPISAAKLEEMKQYGLPIYSYVESPLGEQYHVERRELIYPGDPLKQEAYRQELLSEGIHPN